MKPIFQSAIVLPFISLMLCACSGEGTSSANPVLAAAPVSIVRTTTTLSQIRAGSGIAAKTRVLSEVKINQPVTVELVLMAAPNQTLLVNIIESEDLQLHGDYRRVVESNDDGRVTKMIELTPLKAGKHYLKMTVSEFDGSSPRSVAVILQVEDQTGTVPKTQSVTKDRIDFKAIPLQ